MVKCPKCGVEIRYITAAPSLGSNGIIAVDVKQEELISETGRVLRGYRAHRCREKQYCTRQGTTTADHCHAFNGGECMNEVACPSLG
jgi:hypothetical protein